MPTSPPSLRLPLRRYIRLNAALCLGFLTVFAWVARPGQSIHGTVYDQAPNSTSNACSAMLGASESPNVVINEVAWGGTAASSADEWIELYNTTELTLSLDGWQLSATDGGPLLALTGVIAPHGYYLIERTDDNTVSDVPADLIATFGNGLANTGETLSLMNPQGTTIDTANADGGPWPNDDEGAAPDYRSMERHAPDAPDTDDSWISNDGTTTTGHDAAGQPIQGTPKAINSAFYPRWLQHADLTIVKYGPSGALPGDLITYNIQLRNRGGLTATQVNVTDTLPLGASFVGQSSTWPFTHTEHMATWYLPAMPPGADSVLRLTARVSTTVTPGQWLTNCVSITAMTAELNVANNATVQQTLVQTPSADLRVSKSGPAVVLDQDPFTYGLNVKNLGPSPAYSPVLTDVLPLQLRLLGYTTSEPISPTGTPLVWALPTLPPGAEVLLTLTVQLIMPITNVHVITNYATANSQTFDAFTVNNSATAASHVGEPQFLISGVLYDGYQLYDRDEAIELINVGSAPGTLDGWELCKDVSGEQRCYALDKLFIAPGERVWLVRDADAFATSFGFVPQMVVTPWLGLANTGDEVLLRDPSGHVADTLVYGDGELNVPGWSGPPLTWYYNHLRGQAGQILSRIPDEITGLPISDTNTLNDWIQNPSDPRQARRVRYPGWDEASLFHPLSIAVHASITVGIAPDNAFEVISTTLMSARKAISAELYTLTHPDLMRVLARKAEEGVAVTVLLAGNPVGVGTGSAEWNTELYACQLLETSGGACWFMVHKPDDHRYARYTYLHAKMILVDDTWLAISTQNLTPPGLSTGGVATRTSGSRGAVIVTDAPSLIHRATSIFSLDFDPTHHNDLVRWNTEYSDTYGMPDPNLVDLYPPEGLTYTIRFADPLISKGELNFELLTAPEAALRRTDALIGLIERTGAGDEIDVEQMYEKIDWGGNHEDNRAPNLRLEAYIEAARRGARVRILLNGHPFAEGADVQIDNAQTVAHLNDIALREGINLRAAVGDPTGDGIHNKMVLVRFANGDSYTHLGSINGSEASSKVNREVAVQVRSSEVYAYLQTMFASDWYLANPTYLPLALHHYTPPPPPADYPLISEVLYNTSTDQQWVEIFNPTATPIDLTNWKLGDAETPDVYEPMFRFPDGIQLAAGKALVIAVNADAVPQADLEFYPHKAEIPDMILYPSWGDPDYPFALRNAGDAVLLLDQTDILVDGAVWGDGTLQHIVPHPGVSTRGASLERIDPTRDTDNCALDFVQRYPPTPGTDWTALY